MIVRVCRWSQAIGPANTMLTGWRRNRKLVTTPKLPPPPRSALLASRDEPTVGENEIRFDQIIDGQAISARQIAVAAAQGKAGDASGGNDAGRRCQPERVRGMVHVA